VAAYTRSVKRSTAMTEWCPGAYAHLLESLGEIDFLLASTPLS
jgi:hypothetical protein